MKLVKALELNGIYQRKVRPRSKVAAQCLGDAYLYEKNSTYRQVREALFAAGFSLADSDFCHYTVLPLAALDAMIRARSVPCIDNVTVLEQIEQSRPGAIALELVPSLRKNYLIHEASHCVAFAALRTLPRLFANDKREREQWARSLLAETFANTAETYAIRHCSNDTHLQLYSLNSYFNATRDKRAMLKNCAELLGPTHSAALLYLSYLFSNFLYKPPLWKTWNAVLSAMQIRIPRSGSVRKLGLELLAQGFRLNVGFRLLTNSFYLRYGGYKKSMFELTRFSLPKLIEENEELQSWIRDCAMLISGEFSPSAFLGRRPTADAIQSSDGPLYFVAN